MRQKTGSGKAVGGEGHQGHPPGDPQALWRGGEDPHRVGRASRRGADRGACADAKASRKACITTGRRSSLKPARSGWRVTRRVTSARPCSMTSACACCCSSSYSRAARDADGVRRMPRYDQCIPCRSIRSAVRHTHFAMVSEETSGDLEYRWTEPDAGMFCRRRHRGPGSGNKELLPAASLSRAGWRSIRPSDAR